MKENGKKSPPEVIPPYIQMVRDPQTRRIGIERALDTYQQAIRENGITGGEISTIAQVLLHTADLDQNRYMCEVEGHQGKCDDARIQEYELGLFVQNADRIRVQKQQTPTILFELTPQLNGKKPNPEE